MKKLISAALLLTFVSAMFGCHSTTSNRPCCPAPAPCAAACPAPCPPGTVPVY